MLIIAYNALLIAKFVLMGQLALNVVLVFWSRICVSVVLIQLMGVQLDVYHVMKIIILSNVQVVVDYITWILLMESAGNALPTYQEPHAAKTRKPQPNALPTTTQS